MEQQQPLLSPSGNDSVVDSWMTYEDSNFLTGEKVQLESNFSETDQDKFSYYPSSIHGTLISSPDPPPLSVCHAPFPSHGVDLMVASQGQGQEGYACQEVTSNYQCSDPSAHTDSCALDEMEIRQLLSNHVRDHCCWGNEPARRWHIHSIENCSAYVGTLETFIEERETVTEKEPYMGGEIDGVDKGPHLGIWELDLQAHFPQIFTPEKEVRIKIPHTEAVQKCDDCNSRGKTICSNCQGSKTRKCFACDNGLIDSKDGSDTRHRCPMCNGRGQLDCGSCSLQGTVTCRACDGYCSLLTRSIAVVRWKTLYAKEVSKTGTVASVPDEVFHNARGTQLCNIQAYQCSPAFAGSYDLNNFSFHIISRRAVVPPYARVLSERHIISFLPVKRIIMTHWKRSFSFYIVGNSWDIFVANYPSRCCWGMCCCFEWLNM